MPEIVLHGRLRKKFGARFRLDVANAAEAVFALEANHPGRFFAELRRGAYKVVRGHAKTGLHLDENSLRFGLGSAPLHIIPVPGGAKNGGVVKAVLGVAIIGIAIFASGGTLAAPLAHMSSALPMGGLGLGLTYGNLALFGLTMVLAGVSQMLSPAPKNNATSGESQSSYIFSGPQNSIDQGGPVPLIYGRIRVGSTVVSAALDAENIPV